MSDAAYGEVALVTEPISLTRLAAMAADGFGDFVKAVVDIEQRVMTVGGDLHSDGESALLERGSRQSNLWGINLFPGQFGQDGWVEYASLINIRPGGGNRSRGVEDALTRQTVLAVVNELVDGGN
ncbi:MAG: DUF5674 family protein [Actinomycetota bacterium]|nr:DUF5674 family protein [Actinomycetota bacterium]